MTIYYASPLGLSTNNGLSTSSPIRPRDFWIKSDVVGSTLLLMDGTYQGDNFMINPSIVTTNLSGSSIAPITIRAINEGSVHIDGQGARQPVKLRNNSYFNIEGINAKASGPSGGHVIDIGGTTGGTAGSNFVNIRRVVAWDAILSGNNHIFSVSDSTNVLIEDCAAFGTGDKQYEAFRSQNVTFRRCWGRWENSTEVGPKEVFSPNYRSYSITCENCIGYWHALSTSVNQPTCVFNTDAPLFESDDQWRPSNPRNGNADLQILGCLSIVRTDDTLSIPDTLGIYFTKFCNHDSRALETGTKFEALVDNFLVKDCVSSLEGHATTTSFSGKGRNTTAFPTGPANRRVTNFTALGGVGNSFATTGNYIQSNVKTATTAGNLYPTGQSLYQNDGTRGATILYRYVNRVLTTTPLWPWPMNARIKAATAGSAGGQADVQAVVDAIFGPGEDQDLLYYFGAEDNTLDNFSLRATAGLPYSVTIDNNLARVGGYSYRFELFKSDPEADVGHHRSELPIDNEASLGDTHWYGISIFCPTDWQDDKAHVILTQWHTGAGTGQGVPLDLRIYNTSWYVGDQLANNQFLIGPMAKGAWTDFVLQVKWSKGTDGFLKVWMNSQSNLVHSRNGPTYLPDSISTVINYKWGIYKAVWDNPLNPSGSTSTHIVAYHDEIRIGNSSATYDQVKPGAGTTPQLPAPPTNFHVVSAT